MDNPKIKATAHAGSPNLCLPLAGSDMPDHSTPIKLTEEQIAAITQNLSASANQERRFISVLGSRPDVLTKKACKQIACVNLGHLRIVTASLLARFGLEARCVHPPKPIKNGFGENTGQVHWGLYQLKGGDQHA
jgi:hypothetical protein